MSAWLLWWALCGPAHAGPEDALAEVPRLAYLEARRREANGDLSQAIAYYQRVLDLDPAFEQAHVDKGRVYEALDQPGRAEVAYIKARNDADAVEALGRLYLKQDRHQAAAEAFEDLEQLDPGNPEATRLRIHAVAHYNALRARDELLRFLGQNNRLLRDPQVVKTSLLVAHKLEAVGEEELARTLLEELSRRVNDPTLAALFADDLDRLTVRKQARQLAGAAALDLNLLQQSRLIEAREQFSAGQIDAAAAALEALTQEVTRSPEAWAALSDVREAQGRIADAEACIQHARQLAPDNPDHHRRYGDLLYTHHAGRHDEGAAAAYAQALTLQQTSPQLWLRHARAVQRAGDHVQAMASYQRYLQLQPNGPESARVQRLLDDHNRELPPPPRVVHVDNRPKGVSEAHWLGYHEALVLSARGDDDQDALDAALLELMPIRLKHPDFVDATNLEARIQYKLGKVDQAIALYNESLTHAPDQPGVLIQLAEIHRASGDAVAAADFVSRAAELGSPDARYLLARDAWAAGELWQARDQLDRYFTSTTAGLYHAEARALQEQVEQRITGLQVGGGLLGVTGVLAVPALFWVRRRGSSLVALLERAPAAYPEVARLCSAIRHEVLKHNTTVLESVADALDAGDPTAAMWAADKICGPRGAVARFRRYQGEIERLGRVHGVPLNLRHRDEVFGPLIVAMDRLMRLEKDLRRGNPRIASELRTLSQTLNQTGYRGLGRLLSRVLLLDLDTTLLREVFGDVRNEGPFRDAELALTVDGPGEQVLVRVFRTDLEDILVNLLRNSIEASLEVGEHALAVRIALEEDDITGLERVELRVADQAPRRVSTAMIRGRYIERGLGLAVDLVSRNGGSIHVEDEPGWSKAVVVRLPRAEGVDE